MRGEGKRDPRPADSPGRLRQSENGKRNAGNLKPFKPGQSGNPSGRNGSRWTAEFRAFFDTPTASGVSRFTAVLQAVYASALRGSEQAQKTIIDHMKGRAKEEESENPGAGNGGAFGVLVLPPPSVSAAEWEASLGPLCRAPDAQGAQGAQQGQPAQTPPTTTAPPPDIARG